MNNQLELFTESEKDNMAKEMAILREQVTNLRRGLFGRYDKLVNELSELQNEIATLKNQISEDDVADKIIHLLQG